MILRCTAKTLTLLGTRPVPDLTPADDDWYLNLLWVNRRKCLLLVHAGTLFPIFAASVRKTDLNRLGAWLATSIRTGLAAEGLSPNTFGDLDRDDVVVTKTASRSILGFMVDMAMVVEHHTRPVGGFSVSDVAEINHVLRRNLHNRGGKYVRPIDAAATWRSDTIR
jgi:hypothetical protein